MIVARHLVKFYANNIVFRDVSLRLEDGALNVLTGPSGSGKSTILRILAGLDRSAGGTVHIDDQLVTGEGICVAPNLRGIGFVFQSPTLWPHMTVAGNVGFAIPAGTSRSRREKSLALLEEVGIAELADRYPGEVSQGQAHRVSLARALAPEPRHLFLDEPLANLDEATRVGLLDLIKNRILTSKTSVLYVTHDREEMRQLGGTRLSLRDGRLRVEATEGVG